MCVPVCERQRKRKRGWRGEGRKESSLRIRYRNIESDHFYRIMRMHPHKKHNIKFIKQAFIIIIIIILIIIIYHQIIYVQHVTQSNTFKTA